MTPTGKSLRFVRASGRARPRARSIPVTWVNLQDDVVRRLLRTHWLEFGSLKVIEFSIKVIFQVSIYTRRLFFHGKTYVFFFARFCVAL